MREYIKNLNIQFKTKKAREHSYRGAFEEFLKKVIDEDVVITNEPARVEVGAPDFVISKNNIPLCYIEAKDITKNLENKEFKEQFSRYIKGLDNVIFTNYLDFIFYSRQKEVARISIGKIENNEVVGFFEKFDEFKRLINAFIKRPTQTIKSPKILINLMANRALLLKDILSKTLKDKNSTLYMQYEVFKKVLIHDISEDEFADIFAQTIAFGLFIARYHDYTLENFSREEARRLIPSSHPFLKGLFKYISDDDEVDSRIIWIIDELTEIFLRTNLRELIKEDEIIYFYEDFLSEYDPVKRKQRGVYYTPKEVVKFMVNSTDLILKDEFGVDGLASDVKILDPATGTGTFLAEIVKFLKNDPFIINWDEFKEKLINRLFGFELLMASYAMAHLKMDILLNPKKRLNIYLTNSLEPPNEDYASIFSTYLALESREADRIKKEEDVRVVIGNPPYSVSSANKNEWIEDLMKDYKEGLNEKNIQPLSDDYIKFIRLAQWYIEKNKRGIIAFITNNSFLDGIIHRQMRKKLLESFDKIYILNLHGDSKKNETSPNGNKDENVFDIRQGVSINIFVKTSDSKKQAKVYYYDLYGKREFKYNFLIKNDINSISWQELETKKPYYFFIPKDFSNEKEYKKGFKINELFKVYSSGIETGKDELFIAKNKEKLKEKIRELFENPQEILEKYKIKSNSNFRLLQNIKKTQFSESNIKEIDYRVFDKRFVYYDNLLLRRGFEKVQKHLFFENIALVTIRLLSSNDFNHIFVSEKLVERCFISNKGKETNYIFPLYLYNDENNLVETKSLNLNEEIIKNFEKKLKLPFKPLYEINLDNKNQDSFSEIDIIAYIYAVLHNPEYREKYNEFLKIDFPRIPYPNKKRFFKYAELGKKLIKLHLKKEPFSKVVEFIGDDTKIEKINKKSIKYIDDKVEVKINKTSKLIIPKVAFDFYIGGYQVVLKFLKDNNELNRETFKELNQIVDILIKTDEVMQEIKEIK